MATANDELDQAEIIPAWEPSNRRAWPRWLKAKIRADAEAMRPRKDA